MIKWLIIISAAIAGDSVASNHPATAFGAITSTFYWFRCLWDDRKTLK